MHASQFILRVVQWIFTIIIMALDGNIIAIKNGHSPAVINYTMFVATFSMLSLFYLTLVAYNEDLVGMALIPITLDTLNVIFTLTCGIALAAELGAHSCTNTSYLISNRVTRGTHSLTQVCREAQASTAFLWFLFAVFVGSLALSAMGVRSGGADLRPKFRKGPAMSQV